MVKKQESEEPQENIDESIIEEAQQAVSNENTDELRKQLEEIKESALRAAADAENTRKRAAKDVEEANKYGVSSIAKDLIHILENLQRAIDSVPEKEQKNVVVKNLVEGVELTKKELINIFEKRGITRIEPNAGEKFDHNFHQAMAQVEEPTVESGCIISVLQAGYIIHDRLLRPAMVTVSKGEGQPTVDTSA